MELMKNWCSICTCILWLCWCIGALDSGENLHKITVNPTANAIMGAVVQVQERGMGLFGCGPPSKEGVIRVEAMRWMTGFLNQEWANQTFLPNITLGVQVFDSCGRMRVAASHLGELLPMLRGDDGAQQSTDTRPLLQLGLIDGAGLLADAEVRDTLEHFQVPVVTMDADTMLVAAGIRAKAMVAMCSKLNWKSVSVVHDNDYYSSQMVDFFMRYSPDDGKLFLKDIEPFAPGYDVLSNSDAASENSAALKLVSLAREGNMPVMIVMHPFAVRNFLEALEHELKSTDSRSNNTLRILFSSVLTHDDLDFLSDKVDVYSAMISPSSIGLFERYWTERIQLLKNMSKPLLLEDKWVFDYINSESYCSAEDCTEDELDVALRTLQVISAGRSVLTLAQALKQAWQIKCTEESCSTNQTAAVASEGDLLLMPHSDRGWLKEVNSSLLLQLVRYQTNNTDGNILNKMKIVNEYDLLKIDEHFKDKPISAYNFNDTKSLPPMNSINAITILPPTTKQNFVETGRYIADSPNQQYLFAPLKHEAVLVPLEASNNYRVLVPSKDNLYVAALFAVHKETHGQSLLQCNSNEDDLDLSAVRQLEAFLWALRRVNSKSGVELGAFLLDSCNSRLRTMTLTAGLDSQHVLAAINALPTADATVAEEIMSAINITSITTGHALALAESVNEQTASPYILQVEAPMSALVASLVSVLKHLGWTYVSVVHSGHGEFYAGFKLFQVAAAKAGICLALQEDIPEKNSETGLDTQMASLIPSLVGARADGARGVVLWTTEHHTKRLLNAVSQAVALGTVAREDFFWMVASPNGGRTELLKQFSNVLGGALLFRPYHRPIREFQHYLQQIHSNFKNTSRSNNPWIKKYIEQCEDIECFFNVETTYPADKNTVQAVYAFGAAVRRARNQLCSNVPSTHPVDGLCSSQYSRVELQQVLNKQLRQSVTERADGAANENFMFTSSGAGNVAIEVLNFRRKSNEMSRSLKNIYFERIGLWIDSNFTNELTPMVAYRESGTETPLPGLTSQCRSSTCCSSVFSADRLTIRPGGQDEDKTPVLYLAATFGAHESSANPLVCGVDVNKAGMEQLEAFLWAVDQVNLNNTHLRLAAVALDTCGSVVKTSRVVTDLLSNPANNSIVALISGGGTELTNPLLDVIGHLKVPVLYAQASGPPAYRKTHSPYPLQLAPSNVAQATAILALLGKLARKCATVFYHQDGAEFEEIFKIIESQVDVTNIKLTGVAIPVASTNISDILREALGFTTMLRDSSTATGVLLLPQERLDLLLRAVHVLDDQGQLNSAHVTWISLGSDHTLKMHSGSSLGALLLRPKAGRVLEFEEHFRNLTIDGNIRNPWFREFWASVFHCRGSACNNQQQYSLHSYQLTQNHGVVNTINAVLAVAHALETVARDLCPESLSSTVSCAEASKVSRVRQRLFEVTPRMAFVGVGMNAVAFSTNGENAHAGIEVMNLQPSGLESVGYFDSSGAPLLNVTQIKSYVTRNRIEVLVRDVKSSCFGRKLLGTRENSAHLLELLPNRHLSLLGVMAAGEAGAGMFACGRAHPAADLQLAALRLALDQVNLDPAVLPGIQIGLTVLDSCSRPAAAHNAVYNYLASADSEGRLMSEDIFAAVTLDEPSASTVDQLLSAHNISQLVVPTNFSVLQSFQLFGSPSQDQMAVQLKDSLLHAILSLIHSLNSHSYSIIRGNSKNADYLTQHLRNQSVLGPVCLAGIYTIRGEPESDSGSTMITEEVAQLLRPGTLVILLVEDPKQMQQFLEACRGFHSLIFLAVLQSADFNFNGGINTVLNLSPSYYIEQHLSEMAAKFAQSLGSKQAKVLDFSTSNDTNALLVTKETHRHVLMFKKIMGSVITLSKGLHNFIDRHCQQKFDIGAISECILPGNEKRNMRQIFQDEVFQVFPSFSFEVWNENAPIGTWNKSYGLKISEKLPKFISHCRSLECTVCGSSRRRDSNRHTAFYQNLQHPYSAVLGGLALLGAFLTILTTVYFLAAAAIPNNNVTGSTSVLGYLILLGLMLLFTANLSFVLVPTEVTCGVRRFLPGFAYAMIFSGMLLKVVVTLRFGRISSRGKDVLSRPTALVVAGSVLSLVQILLAGGWLTMVPPRTHSLGALTNPATWRCYPSGNFQVHLILSLTYIFLLLTLTAIFALLCILSSRRKCLGECLGEAGWIMIACLLVAAVFTAWGVGAMLFLTPGQADLATAATHLLTAYVLLLCLYVPKVILYSRLKSGKKVVQNNLHPVYDITHFQPSTLKTLPNFASPILGMGMDMMEVDDDLLDDPTQVVPSSLYSLSMFSAVDDECSDENASHCEPGTNEFTVPVHLSNPLLNLSSTLDSDSTHESISYM